jgi:hypothetical protein
MMLDLIASFGFEFGDQLHGWAFIDMQNLTTAGAGEMIVVPGGTNSIPATLAIINPTDIA